MIFGMMNTYDPGIMPIFSSCFELAPITKVRLKQRGGDWFDDEILELISKRDKALVRFKKSKNPEDYSEYKRLRNMTQRTVTKANKHILEMTLKKAEILLRSCGK